MQKDEKQYLLNKHFLKLDKFDSSQNKRLYEN